MASLAIILFLQVTEEEVNEENGLMADDGTIAFDNGEREYISLNDNNNNNNNNNNNTYNNNNVIISRGLHMT